MKNYTYFIVLIVLFVFCKEQHKATYPILSKTKVKTPKLFAEGVISTQSHDEFNIAFAPDGYTVYFTRRPKDSLQKIYSTTYQNGRWGAPQIISFSNHREEAPFVTPDGNTLYYGATRPIEGRPNQGNFDMNIWSVSQENGSWKSPTPLSSTINEVQRDGEEWPLANASTLFTLDGTTFYFSTMARGSKNIEIYRTELEDNTFSKPFLIEGLLAGNYWKSSPCISPDGNYLFFNAYGASGGFGGEDIYVSKRENDTWSPAKNLGKLINSSAEEGSVAFSPDGTYFFFSRNTKSNANEDGIYSLYFMETKYLDIEHLFN